MRTVWRDPASGLWEFWHVESGDEPLRDADGKLVLVETSGIVLVLIPGGSFWMGAQAGDPERRNHDPGAASGESPVHEVALSAYFLSKCELTQGQWERFAGSQIARPKQVWYPDITSIPRTTRTASWT